MTNAELIATIRNEIERRITDNTFGAKLELIDILAWLDTLESENPMNPDEDLNDEIKKFIEEYGYERGEDKLLIAIVARHFAELGYLRAAEKYNEIEYNRQRAEEDTPNDLEEAADEHVNNIAYCGDDIELEKEQSKRDFISGAKWQENKDQETIKLAEDHAFLAGADWQKEQMMKEAVEGEVCGRVYDHINVRFTDGICKFLEPKNISHIPADVSKYKVGDKVRVIIVKEDEK